MARVALKPADPKAHKEWDSHALASLVSQAFCCLHEANPLRKLEGADKLVLYEALFLFANAKFSGEKTETGGRPFLDQIEETAKTAKEATELASRIRKIIQYDKGKALNQRLEASADLPERLDAFAEQAAWVHALGETWLKRKRTMGDMYLVYASEFVRLNTGTWNDEHLAELLYAMRSEPTDFWGDAIRKTRERYKINRPLIYETIVHNISVGRTPWRKTTQNSR